MDVISLQEHGLSNFEFDIIEEEQHKETNISLELAVETGN